MKIAKKNHLHLFKIFRMLATVILVVSAIPVIWVIADDFKKGNVYFNSPLKKGFFKNVKK